MKKKNLKYLIKANERLTPSYLEKITALVNEFKTGKRDVLIINGGFSVLVLDEDNEIIFGDENGILKGGDVNEDRNPKRQGDT